MRKMKLLKWAEYQVFWETKYNRHIAEETSNHYIYHAWISLSANHNIEKQCRDKRQVILWKFAENIASTIKGEKHEWRILT